MTVLQLVYDITKRQAQQLENSETTDAESVKNTVDRLLVSTQVLVRTVENMPSLGPEERPYFQLQA